MATILIELGFRLAYGLGCVFLLITWDYFTCGWQYEYWAGRFNFDCQYSDYCFSESIVWENHAVTDTWVTKHIAQTWTQIYLTNVTPFYGVALSLKPTFTLSMTWFLSVMLGLILIQIQAFLGPGLVHKRPLGELTFLCFVCVVVLLTGGLSVFSISQEFAFERFDSELLPALEQIK